MDLGGTGSGTCKPMPRDRKVNVNHVNLPWQFCSNDPEQRVRSAAVGAFEIGKLNDRHGRAC